MEIKDIKIKIKKGDITEEDCDAICNAANNHFYMGGGVAAAIKKRGGIEIEQDAVDQGPVEVGKAVTTSGYRLKSRLVIHAAVMGMDFKTDKKIIKKATISALEEAERNNCQSIAFPALGCGVGRIPYQESALAMQEAIKEYLTCKKTSLPEIIFVLYEEEAFLEFQKVFNN